MNVNAVSKKTVGETLMNRVVVLKPEAFYRPPEDRRFLCTGGFGCFPYCRGKAVFGKLLSTGVEGRISRYDVEGIAEHGQIGEKEQERDFQKVE